MLDGRSERKAKVIPFIDKIEKDRKSNLQKLADRAKFMRLEGFESVKWEEDEWLITGGRLLKIKDRNSKTITISFRLSPKLGSTPLIDEWSVVAKSLFILRFHRKNQNLANQRLFIGAVSYVAYAASELGQDLLRLTPEVLDNACLLISKHYSKSSAYNLHKFVAEFASHCDANYLCRTLLQYKFSQMKRPSSVGGLGNVRLDDPKVFETESDKLIAPNVFKVIGELYQKVPKEHKYRTYILMLTLLACTGRRFSEISLLPYQELSFDEEGKAYFEYFPKKSSLGESFTPKRKLYLPSEVVTIVAEVFDELIESTADARSTANEMQKSGGPDLRFLETIPEEQKLYANDLKRLGISPGILSVTGWLRKNDLVWFDADNLVQNGVRSARPRMYTTREPLKSYCHRDFFQNLISVKSIDQFGKEYYLKDLLIVRHMGFSSGAIAHWLATACTSSMFGTFLRYFPALAEEYASKAIEVDFSSHHFRHTLNTLLDEGGLSDLLQTEWFGRTNPRDTKAYQHTSPQKRALMLRSDIREGVVGGRLVEQLKVVPVDLQDAFLKARIQAVHDVGTGLCVHNFSQTPCERHLQCSADCKDYLWVKGDKGRLGELKKQYALTFLARQTAEKQSGTNKPKKSNDWLLHNDKKLKTLTQQLKDNGIEDFDPIQYLKEGDHEKAL